MHFRNEQDNTGTRHHSRVGVLELLKIDLNPSKTQETAQPREFGAAAAGSVLIPRILASQDSLPDYFQLP